MNRQENKASVLSCFHGAEISDLDRSFYISFMGGKRMNWWDVDETTGKYPTFDDLSETFKKEFQKVNIFTKFKAKYF